MKLGELTTVTFVVRSGGGFEALHTAPFRNNEDALELLRFEGFRRHIGTEHDFYIRHVDEKYKEDEASVALLMKVVLRVKSKDSRGNRYVINNKQG